LSSISKNKAAFPWENGTNDFFERDKEKWEMYQQFLSKKSLSQEDYLRNMEPNNNNQIDFYGYSDISSMPSSNVSSDYNVDSEPPNLYNTFNTYDSNTNDSSTYSSIDENKPIMTISQANKPQVQYNNIVANPQINNNNNNNNNNDMFVTKSTKSKNLRNKSKRRSEFLDNRFIYMCLYGIIIIFVLDIIMRVIGS